MIIRQQYLDALNAFVDKPLVKVIAGMRRVGKSVLMRQAMQAREAAGISSKQILYIDKESLDFDGIRTHLDLNQWVQARKLNGKKTSRVYLYIDEVQEIAEWERAVVSLHGEGWCDITLTGSNAHLLSGELSTLLSGRHVVIPVYPLTLREFALFRKAHGNKENTEESFWNYVRVGGLPGIHDFSLQSPALGEFVRNLYSAILLRDVVGRFRIRDVSVLERVARFVLANCGNITTAKSIADYFKSQRLQVTLPTVLNYLDALEAAWLVRKVGRIDLQGKKNLEFHDKYYAGDIGLRNGLVGYRETELPGLLENIVCLELMARGYSVCTGQRAGLEVDFVAERADERMYLQVCYKLSDATTVEREFRSLDQIDDHWPKLVLSLDPHWEGARKGIRWVNLIQWLMKE